MIKEIQRFLHLFQTCSDQIALFNPDLLPRFNGFVALLDQSHVFDQYFHRQPGDIALGLVVSAMVVTVFNLLAAVSYWKNVQE